MRKIFPYFVVACTMIDALQSIRPGALWNLSGTNYEGLVWLDAIQAKPTLAELNQAVVHCQTTQNDRNQAVLDAKNTNRTPQQRLDALIKAIDLK